MAASNDDSTTEYEVHDIEDFISRERAKDILEARRLVVQRRSAVSEARLQHGVDEFVTRTAMRDAVDALLLEVVNLLRQAETEVDYLTGYGLGTMALPNGEQFTFAGLQDYLECPNPICIESVREEDDNFDGQQTVRETQRLQIPVQISWTAFRAVVLFLGDVDFDIELEQVEDEEGILELEDAFDGFELPEDIRQKVNGGDGSEQ